MLFKRKMQIGLEEYTLSDIPGLVGRTERYRDLIRAYEHYVSFLEQTGLDSPETQRARLDLRDALKKTASQGHSGKGYGFFPRELEEIAEREEQRLLTK